MKMLKKIILPIFLLLILLLVMVSSAGAQAKTNQVVIGLNPMFRSFDPGRAYQHYVTLVTNACYDNLVKFEKGKVKPVNHLAESYEVSPDGKVFTFKLKSGVKFASGNNLTSKDVKWSFERTKNLKSDTSFLADGIDKVEIPDEKTVRVFLSEPDGAFLYKLTAGGFAVVDSEVVKSQGGVSGANASTDDTAEEWLNHNSAGSGPYILKEWIKDTRVTLERNDNYWKGPAAIERIILLNVPEQNSQLFMVQEGDIDIAWGLNADQIEQLKDEENVEIMGSPTLSFVFLVMNEDPEIGGPMANRDVQNAVRYALDYKGIQEIAGEGSITPISIIQQGFLGALPPRDPGFTDVEKAKELLAKAGYPDGFSVDFAVTTNKKTEGVSWVILGQKIKEDLSKIGINAEIVTMENTIAIQQYKKGEGAFRIAGWQPDYIDANNELLFCPGDKCGLRANWKIANPYLTQLKEAALKETDDTKRAALLGGIQGMMVEDGPWLPLVQVAKHIAIKKGLKGIEFSNAYRLELYSLFR